MIFCSIENFDIDKPILKYDYIRYKSPSLATKSRKNSQVSFDIPREASVISLKHSYLEFDFDVERNARGIYADAQVHVSLAEVLFLLCLVKTN